MELSEVRDCVALGNGGALQIQTLANASIVDCRFTRNRAYKDGGGMQLKEAASIYCKGCIFTECTAVHGGGVRMRGGESMITTIEFCTFFRCGQSGTHCNFREFSIGMPCEHRRCSAAYHPLMAFMGFTTNSDLIIEGGAISASYTQVVTGAIVQPRLLGFAHDV